ncbi:MAG: DUF4339 domain-containing protein [Thermoguttaceae bacterium]
MADWYYADGDIQRGPVSREKLLQLITAGQVGAADLVWTDTMGDWAPAGQVPGLIPAGAAAARRGYEEAPVRKSGWEALSPGAKVSIMVCSGGLLVVLLIVLVFALAMPPEKEPTVVEKPKPPVHVAKPVTPPVKPGEAVAVPTYDDFDVKSLTAAQKKFYDEGFRQVSDKSIDTFAPGAKAAASGKGLTKAQLLGTVKGIIEYRNLVIYLAEKHHGRHHRDTIVAFGCRDGVKAWLKAHALPLPNEK